jgi:hypothetical protein
MPVLGARDKDCIDIFARQKLSVVAIGAHFDALFLRAVRLRPFQAWFADIADRKNFEVLQLLLGQAKQ